MLKPSPYHDPRTWKMTPAMIRARKPYFKKNMIGLGILVSITVGVYTYAYKMLHKDEDFADVSIPPIDEAELERLKKEYLLHKQNRDKERQ